MTTQVLKEVDVHDTTAISSDARRDALIDRLLHSASGAFNIFTVYIGDQLGFYRALAEEGPMTSEELATRTGTHERYAREWLEQQTGAGLLEVEDATVGAKQRRYRLRFWLVEHWHRR